MSLAGYKARVYEVLTGEIRGADFVGGQVKSFFSIVLIELFKDI